MSTEGPSKRRLQWRNTGNSIVETKQLLPRSTPISRLMTATRFATVAGEMKVEITRLASDGGDQFWLRFKLPGGEALDVKIRRVQLLEQLDVGDGES
jgi:chemotaxis receptor (MCP) glutamine deamidase CheD